MRIRGTTLDLIRNPIWDPCIVRMDFIPYHCLDCGTFGLICDADYRGGDGRHYLRELYYQGIVLSKPQLENVRNSDPLRLMCVNHALAGHALSIIDFKILRRPHTDNIFLEIFLHGGIAESSLMRHVTDGMNDLIARTAYVVNAPLILNYKIERLFRRLEEPPDSVDWGVCDSEVAICASNGKESIMTHELATGMGFKTRQFDADKQSLFHWNLSDISEIPPVGDADFIRKINQFKCVHHPAEHMGLLRTMTLASTGYEMDENRWSDRRIDVHGDYGDTYVHGLMTLPGLAYAIRYADIGNNAVTLPKRVLIGAEWDIFRSKELPQRHYDYVARKCMELNVFNPFDNHDSTRIKDHCYDEGDGLNSLSWRSALRKAGCPDYTAAESDVESWVSMLNEPTIMYCLLKKGYLPSDVKSCWENEFFRISARPCCGCSKCSRLSVYFHVLLMMMEMKLIPAIDNMKEFRKDLLQSYGPVGEVMVDEHDSAFTASWNMSKVAWLLKRMVEGAADYGFKNHLPAKLKDMIGIWPRANVDRHACSELGGVLNLLETEYGLKPVDDIEWFMDNDPDAIGSWTTTDEARIAIIDRIYGGDDWWDGIGSEMGWKASPLAALKGPDAHVRRTILDLPYEYDYLVFDGSPNLYAACRNLTFYEADGTPVRIEIEVNEKSYPTAKAMRDCMPEFKNKAVVRGMRWTEARRRWFDELKKIDVIKGWRRL